MEAQAKKTEPRDEAATVLCYLAQTQAKHPDLAGYAPAEVLEKILDDWDRLQGTPFSKRWWRKEEEGASDE